MTQQNRKLAGTLLTIVWLIGYAWAIMLVHEQFLIGSPWWVLIPFFAVTGLLWGVPAAWIIRWMARPD